MLWDRHRKVQVLLKVFVSSCRRIWPRNVSFASSGQGRALNCTLSHPTGATLTRTSFHLLLLKARQQQQQIHSLLVYLGMHKQIHRSSTHLFGLKAIHSVVIFDHDVSVLPLLQVLSKVQQLCFVQNCPSFPCRLQGQLVTVETPQHHSPSWSFYFYISIMLL